MKRVMLPAVAAILLVGGCAKKPDEIAAADVGQGIYRGASCAALSSSLTNYRHSLENLSAAQLSAAQGDALGVFLLGLPLSSMSGNDKEAAIAVAKGHIQQIEAERERKGCRA